MRGSFFLYGTSGKINPAYALSGAGVMMNEIYCNFVDDAELVRVPDLFKAELGL